MTHLRWTKKYQKRNRYFLYLTLLFLLAAAQAKLLAKLYTYAGIGGLHTYSEESEEFRDMNISLENLQWAWKCSEKNQIAFPEFLAAAMVLKRFDLSGSFPEEKNVLNVRENLLDKKGGSYQRLTLAYEKIFSDLQYFPIPRNTASAQEEQSFFENSYGEARNFGGKRSHEGVDIFGMENMEEYYPVVSVTDGVIEKIGWLPLGGYRIGIRSPHGGYFYYAHLSSYGKNYQVGDPVDAGEILGFMGSTGYGPVGTSGKFPVHLHFGIYIAVEHQEEMSVNPYPVLLLLKKQTQEYHY